MILSVEYPHLSNSEQVEYLIKWEGYPEEESTWEKAQNISADLIADFEESQKKVEMSETTADENLYVVEYLIEKRKVGNQVIS